MTPGGEAVQTSSGEGRAVILAGAGAAVTGHPLGQRASVAMHGGPAGVSNRERHADTQRKGCQHKYKYLRRLRLGLARTQSRGIALLPWAFGGETNRHDVC